MDEIGKWFVSVALMAVGGFLIVLSCILGILNLLAVLSIGIALCGFGGFLYYLRYVSVTSQTRVKKAKVTRVIREVPKAEPKPEMVEEKVEKPKKSEILCDTCQFYDEDNPKRKCKFLVEKDRLAIINAGIQCVEYKIELSLLDEE
jgi:hypothetical protein